MKRERRRRVTLKDIAEKTGYSVITISKALRDSSDLADSTIQRIRETAKEMGYVVNSAANALRSGQTKMIALTLVDISNPFWSCFAKKADAIARAHGYTTMIMNTDMDGGSEEFVIRTAVERGVDGLIIDPSVCYRENVQVLEKMGIPFVVVSYMPEEDNVDSVFFDEYQGSYLLAKRLISQGRRRLIMLNLPGGLPSATVRAKAVLDALQEEDLGPEHVLIANVPNGDGECIRVLRETLAMRPDADGILTYSDHRAMEVADELMEMGIRIPEDIALVGCGNQETHLRIPFSLTTIDAPPLMLAREATELLIKRMQEDFQPKAEHIQIPVHLVERKSG
jgi:LacI family transcriptional regulator